MMTWTSIRKALTRPAFGAPSKKGRRRERGVALLIVITSIAILTVVAVDFQFNSAVDLQLAANARDELRAQYLARSAVNVSRLLLRFQKQLDAQSQTLGPALAALGIPGGAGVNIRLWEIVPVDCSLFSMLLGAPGGSGEKTSDAPEYGGDLEAKFEGLSPKGAKMVAQSFGDFSGCFHADISDEEQKINVNRLNNPGQRGRPPMMQSLLLLADPRFEFVYDKPDANGVKMTPHEVLIALHDWIDERDTQASLNLTGSGIDAFPDGFGDENRNSLSKYPYRYRSKNAPFDTLDELYQVDGVSDLFMAAFRDRLTVYPDKNKVVNINTNDPIQEYINILTVAANEGDPKLAFGGVVHQAIHQQIAVAKLFSFLGMSAKQFLAIVSGNGVQLKPDLSAQASGANNWITDKSETFTIRATGQAGRVEKNITAVVRYNEALGKVLYFREE
jgi:general secretion pathway protein K